MTSSQFSSFNASETGISDSIFYHNGTASQNAFHVSQGLYYLVFDAYSESANVTFNLEVLPNNPLQFGPLSSPQPTGIASFGLYNDSGNLSPYTIPISEVVGVANIKSLSAYNATASASDSAISGATLQLNSILVIQQKDGLQNAYWCQNAPDFVTAASKLAYADNIWNSSVSGVLSNSSITSEGGGGAVYSFNNNGVEQYAYLYGSINSTYFLPLNLVLLMREKVSQAQGVLVQMGLQVLGNGTAGAAPVDWFDNATIHDPGAQDAYFLISGNETTPNGYFYDAELVFGGEGYGESTFFSQMNASLGLFYAGPSNENLIAFPSYFSFGGETGEAADNLRVISSGNGFSQVSVGVPDYVYLGRAIGSFTLVTPTVTTSSASSSTSVPSITSSTVSSTTSSLMARTSTESGSPGGGLTTSTTGTVDLVGVVIVVLLIVVFLIAIVARHQSRRKSRALP
jgi:thermopsin